MGLMLHYFRSEGKDNWRTAKPLVRAGRRSAGRGHWHPRGNPIGLVVPPRVDFRLWARAGQLQLQADVIVLRLLRPNGVDIEFNGTPAVQEYGGF
jgi:hypothetical protein